MAANLLPNLFTRLREPKVQAFVADQIDDSLMNVHAFERLDHLAEREFAQEHYMLVEDANGVFILCPREGVTREATFNFTGVVTEKSTLPYRHPREFTQGTAWAPGGYQYIVLTTPGLQQTANVKRAISNIHVLARLRFAEGMLKPLTDLIVDGEDAVCASTPIGTAMAHMVAEDEPLALTEQQDPNGVVAQYLHQRAMVVLEDNQVDVYLASHGNKAGMYELHGGNCGFLLRGGQVARVEVGFRVVPAGHQVMLRMVLRNIVIINDDIVATMAFAEADVETNTVKRVISISSAGPSAVAIVQQPRVKRAARKPKNLPKDVKEDASMGAPE